jgi:hypothetical protein
MKALRYLTLVATLLLVPRLEASGPRQVSVTRETLPKHIQIEISSPECQAAYANSPPIYGPVWYATIKARLADIPSGEATISVKLFDPKTDRFLFNPGEATARVENGYVVAGIAFEPTILDKIVFEWLEDFTMYRIRLRDFFDGEMC